MYGDSSFYESDFFLKSAFCWVWDNMRSLLIFLGVGKFLVFRDNTKIRDEMS